MAGSRENAAPATAVDAMTITVALNAVRVMAQVRSDIKQKTS